MFHYRKLNTAAKAKQSKTPATASKAAPTKRQRESDETKPVHKVSNIRMCLYVLFVVLKWTPAYNVVDWLIHSWYTKIIANDCIYFYMNSKTSHMRLNTLNIFGESMRSPVAISDFHLKSHFHSHLVSLNCVRFFGHFKIEMWAKYLRISTAKFSMQFSYWAISLIFSLSLSRSLQYCIFTLDTFNKVHPFIRMTKCSI